MLYLPLYNIIHESRWSILLGKVQTRIWNILFESLATKEGYSWAGREECHSHIRKYAIMWNMCCLQDPPFQAVCSERNLSIFIFNHSAPETTLSISNLFQVCFVVQLFPKLNRISTFIYLQPILEAFSPDSRTFSGFFFRSAYIPVEFWGFSLGDCYIHRIHS